MKRVAYIIFNIAAVIIAACFLFLMPGRLFSLDFTSLSFLWLCLMLFAACCAYVLKALRMYLILMEKRMPSGRFSRVYVKVTFVALALPFQLGEVFRAICYGREVKQASYGVFAVLIDRFFDSIPLALFIVGYVALVSSGDIHLISVLILLFIAVSIFAMLAYPSSSKYLNRFLITKTSSERSLRALRVLSILDNYHSTVLFLVRGRTPVLIALSCVAWALEYAAVYSIARYLGEVFNSSSFLIFLNSVFTGSNAALSHEYRYVGGVVFAIVFLIIYGTAVIRKRGLKI